MENTREIIAFDLETTGVEVTKSHIIQIAIKRVRITETGLDTVSAWQTYIKPPVPIPSFITELTGITDAMVADAPTFASIARALVAKLKGCDIMAYKGTALDLPMLAEECSRAMVPFLAMDEVRLIDPYQIFCKNEPRTLSGAMMFYRGETIENAHDAMSDVTAMIAVFEAQIERYRLGSDAGKWAVESKKDTEKDYADFSRMLYWNEKRQLFFGFGKHKDQPVSENEKYADWVLSNDFPANTKSVLAKYLMVQPTLFE